MGVCPLCNALQEFSGSCPRCHHNMEDAGKVSDYLDPYGHYNDDETEKMGDGFPHTADEPVCPHLIVCASCGYDHVQLITYW